MRDIIKDAQAAFWAVVARANPQIKTWNFPPDASYHFDIACSNAVAAWFRVNRVKGTLGVLAAMGFEERSTGGGCTALIFERPDGQQCMVTNNAVAPAPGEGWDVGFYDSSESKMDGGCISVTHYTDLLAALAVIAAWRVG